MDPRANFVNVIHGSTPGAEMAERLLMDEPGHEEGRHDDTPAEQLLP
jgi:hypothetical protein